MRTIIPKNAMLVPKEATCVFKGFICDTYQWQEQMFDGSTGTFEMLKRPDTVEVLLINDNKILIQKQEQPFLGSFHSFPGGRHDHPEETELEAAKRELKEETGLACKEWRLVRAIQSELKIERFLYTFVAHTISETHATAFDPGEKIENIWVLLSEAKKMIEANTFRSSSHVLLYDLTEAQELLELPEYSS